MYYLWIGLFFLLAGTNGALAQMVSTVLPPGSSINDGIAVDSRGAVYVSALGAGRIHVIELDGTHTVLEHGFNGPTGLALDAEDNLYVASEVGNAISKITPDGQKSRFVPRIDNPGGLAFGPDGTLYVTRKDDNGISTVDREGQVKKLINDGEIPRPVGLVVTADGAVYAASIVNGHIYRITPDGTVQDIAAVPGKAVSFMTMAADKLYACAIQDHVVYEITIDGQVRIFAGTGENGNADGDAASAQFNGPHGIAYNPFDHALYITTFNTKSLRRINLPTPTAVQSRSWSLVKGIVVDNK